MCWKCTIFIYAKKKRYWNTLISGGRPPLIFRLRGTHPPPPPRFRRPCFQLLRLESKYETHEDAIRYRSHVLCSTLQGDSYCKYASQLVIFPVPSKFEKLITSRQVPETMLICAPQNPVENFVPCWLVDASAARRDHGKAAILTLPLMETSNCRDTNWKFLLADNCE